MLMYESYWKLTIIIIKYILRNDYNYQEMFFT